MGQRVRYRPMPDRLSMFSVWLVGDPLWLVGFVREVNGRWIARGRGDPLVVNGFPRRRDAAAYLCVAQGFTRTRTEPGGSG